MGAAHSVVVTGLSELQAQHDHPSAEIVRARAIEVFGNENKAEAWMMRPRKIFDNRSPADIAYSDDIEMMRQVLRALSAIEFGAFS